MRPILRVPPAPKRRRPRPRLTAIQVLPTLVTLGNVLAGVLAISYLIDAWGETGSARDRLWTQASLAIFVGMVCDALDGRVARLAGAASTFGAELDSLADMVTFGLAPAMLAKSVAQAGFPEALSPRLATTLAAVYVVGAALRLARYNVESNRLSEPGHVTKVFRGLPSPGAAGVLASLGLVQVEFGFAWIPPAALVATPVLGLLMVSRFAYPHVVNRYLAGARSPAAILLLLVAVFLIVQHPEASLGLLFGLYALTGPVVSVAKFAIGRPRWADDEEDDEDVDEDAGEVEVATAEAAADPVADPGDGEDRARGGLARP
jgi:CDP-diacylglycerol--serine O-phosphatidyltransferase